MKRSAVSKLINEQIQSGKTRQETFEELKEIDYDKKKLRDLVRYTPTLDSREKYKMVNLTLAAILLIFGIIKVIVGVSMLEGIGAPVILLAILIFPLIDILFAVAVLRWRGRVYNGIMLLTGLGLMRSFKEFEGMNTLEIALGVGSAVLVIGVAAYLSLKVVPSAKETKVKITLENGKEKLVTKLVFSDPEKQTNSSLLDG